ncbi:DUF1365 domain-containing protein [Henriciella barbarensis]|uniref:DUF1365 domain-containing protein n=1 Tax=Henriciella barbarensis TaxID=86342 RepID=A0A399R5M6_9PROT|nr:DUF1365 domain-containing protein [Henriciella barbarensis]RIJ26143.1 DUF1365 domain-containing protein [Henriciella barbarensis]
MSSASPALRLHEGDTVHRRFTPFVSDFSYRIFMLEVDIDRLPDAREQCRLFGIDEGALFSFQTDEHGAQGEQSLRGWAEERLLEAGIDASSLRLKLITFPRHLFYKFAPISVWIAEDEDARPAGVIYEVRNTFGERHVYVAAADGGWSRHAADKVFHVSPFFDVSGKYEFSLQRDETTLRLGVSTVSEGGVKHMATLSTKAAAATDSALIRKAVSMPFSTLGVTLAIHWEALKLWLKGANYHPKPHQAQRKVSVATASGRLSEETHQ